MQYAGIFAAGIVGGVTRFYHLQMHKASENHTVFYLLF